MGRLPVVLELQDVEAVVVGGGRVATRRVTALVEAGARVRVIAPEASPALRELAAAGKIDWTPSVYESDLSESVRLVIAASDDPAVNARVATDARALGAWVGVADDPGAGDLVFPAVARDDPITIAIDSGGASPALTRALREWLEDALDPVWAERARLLAALRPLVAERGDAATRGRFWRRLVGELVAQRDYDGATLVERVVSAARAEGLELRGGEVAESVADWLAGENKKSAV